MSRSFFLQSEAFRTTRKKLLPDFWQATMTAFSSTADPWASVADPISSVNAPSTIPIVRACTHPPFVVFGGW
jgi:hypothetical protein